jgi:hypothetical protein
VHNHRNPPESKAKHRDPPLIVPEQLLGRLFKCERCGTEQPVDWLEKQPFPKESIASTVAPVQYVPISFSNNCVHCQHRNDIVAERKELRGGLLISADEASRGVADVSMFLLAGCGISPDKRAEIEAKISALESDLAHESAGTIRAFHAKEIMDQKCWANVNLSKRLKYIRRMSEIARTNRLSKFVTAGAFKGADAPLKRHLRDQVFFGYVIRALELCVASGIRPVFAFDEVERGKRNGWAEECMIGLRRYPLFVWLSRGAHIEDIQHVPPGSTVESKLADCLAFVTAREFERRVANLNVDVNTRWYGRSQFSGYNACGDLVTSDGVGFPWRQVFGLNSVR